MKYLPPFDLVKAHLKVMPSDREVPIQMTFQELRQMIRTILSAVEVDEAFYLARNPDVAEGIRSGDIRSAREHFMDHGYFEGRQPFPLLVDEQWYLSAHPDIAQTVRDGEYNSAQEHFDGPGYPEGRLPFAIGL